MQSDARQQVTILVIYDISKTKKRNNMVAFLESYILRVQKSAFEGVVTKKQYDHICQHAHTLINKQTDSLRIYLLSGTSHVKTWGIGEIHTEETIIL